MNEQDKQQVRELQVALGKFFRLAYIDKISILELYKQARGIERTLFNICPEFNDIHVFPELRDAIWLLDELGDWVSEPSTQHKELFFYYAKILLAPENRLEKNFKTRASRLAPDVLEQLAKLQVRLREYFYHTYHDRASTALLFQKGREIKKEIFDVCPNFDEIRQFSDLQAAIRFIDDLNEREIREHHTLHKERIYYHMRTLG